MLNNLYKSLNQLESSFGKNSKNVLINTKIVEEELKSVKPNFSKDNIKDNGLIENITTLIEKLSIQNEFKLNLLKDFSKHYIEKK